MNKINDIIIDSSFYTLLDNIPIGLFRSTPEGKFVIVNNKMVEMFKFNSKEEMLSYPVSDIYFSRADREKLIGNLSKKKSNNNYEVILKKKDGTLFWGSVSEKAIMDESGNILFLDGILEDISDKKNKEEELLKLGTLVEQAAVSIVLTDKLGDIQYVNPWFQKITGYGKDEVIGKNPKILKSDNSLYPENYFKTMWETINNGDEWHGQFTNRKKSGEDYIEEATIFPIKSIEGDDILGFGAVKKDITRQIELESELENSFREMESLKEKAESASKLKTIFLANMSHDIRTPLNAILGFSDLLHKNKLEKKLDGYVDKIVRSGNILLNLINDILDLSKIEAGQMNIIKNTFYLNDMVENIKSIFQGQFRKKNIDFVIDIEENSPDKIFSDQTRVQQILINLLSNSLKYTLKGKVTLKISYVKTKDTYKFSVKDSGIGIPEDIQDKLFSPFFSNRGQNITDETGTGLGLAICRNLSELLDGEITMKSEFGIGSEFILELPVNSTKIEEIFQMREETFTIDDSDIGEHANKKILIAEDNPVNAELLLEALELRGFKNIEIVNDGEKAIEQAIKQLPQLIIMDNKMPKLSGFEAFGVLRKRGFVNPIFILTADAIKELQEEEIKMMPDSYLTKPINFELLFSEICRVFRADKKDSRAIKNKAENKSSSLMKINKNISPKVKAIFFEELEKNRDYLNNVIDKNEIGKEKERIRIIAHTYKGNAGYFGLFGFEKLAKKLDLLIKNGKSEKNITDLTRKFKETMDEILRINGN